MSNLGKRLRHLSSEKKFHLLEMLPTHLADAGQTERLQRLLTDFAFWEAKGEHLGGEALVADYALGDAELLRLVQHALWPEVYAFDPPPALYSSQWEEGTMQQALAAQIEEQSIVPRLRFRPPLPQSGRLMHTPGGLPGRGPTRTLSQEGTASGSGDQRSLLGHLSPEKHLYLLGMLPTHLADAGQTERLHRLMTNFVFLEAKVSRLGPEALIADYALSDANIFQAFQRTLRQEGHLLAQWPELLWQQIYNRLQWEKGPIQQVLAPELVRRSMPGVTPWLRLRTPLPESGSLIRTLVGHYEAVTTCAFSPDGAKLVSGSDDHTLKLWDVASGQELATLHGHTGWIRACAFSPDGKSVLSGSWDETLKLWDVSTGRERLTLIGHDERVTACAFSPDGDTILSGDGRGRLKVWEAATGRELLSLSDPSGRREPILACTFSLDGTTALSVDMALILRRWDVISGQQRSTTDADLLRTRYYVPGGCAFSPAREKVLTASDTGTLLLWDAASGQECLTIIAHNRRDGYSPRTFGSGWTDKISCAFSPDGATMLSAGDSGTLKLWDTATREERATFAGHADDVTACAFSPDGATAVSGCIDGTLKLWDVAKGQEPTILRKQAGHHTGMVTACAFSPDGATAVSASLDGTLKLWDIASGEALLTLPGHPDRGGNLTEVNDCVFSPGGATILSAGAEGTLKLWDAVSGQELLILLGPNSYLTHPEMITTCAFSPDGATILSGSVFGLLKLWDAHNGKVQLTLQAHRLSVNVCAFSPDEATILSGGFDGTLKFWDAASGRKRKSLIAGPSYIPEGSAVLACAFSPDGATALSAASDPVLTLWDVTTARKRAALIGHTGAILACAFSPDGALIISGSEDYTLKLWDAGSEQLKATLPLPGPVTCLGMHPFQPFVYTGDESGNLYLIELVGITYGPLIVTALENGTDLVVRCPVCRQVVSLDRSQLGQEIICPQPDCSGHMRVNPFVIAALQRDGGSVKGKTASRRKKKKEA